jgi:hypothetical protein
MSHKRLLARREVVTDKCVAARFHYFKITTKVAATPTDGTQGNTIAMAN